MPLSPQLIDDFRKASMPQTLQGKQKGSHGKKKGSPRWTKREEDILYELFKIHDHGGRTDHEGLAHELASKGFTERSALAVRRRLAELKKRKRAGGEEYDDDDAIGTPSSCARTGSLSMLLRTQ